MKKPSLPLLILALVLVGGLAALLSQFGAESGETTPDLVSGTRPSDPEPALVGELPVVERGGGARDLAPLLSRETEPERSAVDAEDIAALREPRPNFTGRVVGPSGEGVPNAKVRVIRDWGTMHFYIDASSDEASITDSNGLFEAKWVSSSSDLRVTVKAAGYAQLSEKVERPKGEGATDLGVFKLEPGVILQGVVLDFHGRPVPEAGVRLEPPGAGEGVFFFAQRGEGEPATTTGPDGRFELDAVAVGPWTITVQHALHPGVRASGVSERVGVHPERILIELSEGGSLSGFVEGPEGDVERVVVATKLVYRDMLDPNLQRHTSVGADGHFELSGLLLEQGYELTVQKDSDQVGFFGEALSESVTARVGQAGVVLVMKGAAGLSFRVVNAETGEPIEDFLAKAGSWWMQALKDGEGKVVKHHPGGRALYADVQVQDPEADGLSLQITAEGFTDHTQKKLQIVPGEVVDLGDIALDPAPVLRVRVLVDATSEPVKGARVKLAGPTPQTSEPSFFGDSGNVVVESFGSFEGPDPQMNRSGKTDEEGWISLTTIPGKECTLSAKHGKYADLELPPKGYGAGEVELRMLAGGTVRVRVLRADGAPAAKTEVAHRLTGASRTESSYESKDTNAKGEIVFRHLTAAAHDFRLDEDGRSGAFVMFEGMDGGASDQEDTWESVEVVEGSESEILLHQAARGVLFGRVTEAGSPLAGATVRLEPWAGEGDEAEGFRAHRGMMSFFGGPGGIRTKSDGSYRMEETKAGEYELVVSHASRVMDEYVRVTLTPGEVEFHVDLSATALEGVVVDQDGRPVSGASVSVQRPGQGQVRHGMAMVMGSTGGGAHISIGSGGGAGDSTTNAEGSFRLKGITSDCELELEVSAGSYQLETVEISPLRPDEVRSGLRVVLIEGGSVEAVILMADGRPAQFGTLILTLIVDGEAEGEPRRAGAHEGAATVEGLAPGEWKATASVYDLANNGALEPEQREQVIEVKPGEITKALFQF